LTRESISHTVDIFTAFEGIAVFSNLGETISFNTRMEQILGCTADDVPSLENMLEKFFTSNSGNAPLGMEKVRACSDNGAYVRVAPPGMSAAGAGSPSPAGKTSLLSFTVWIALRIRSGRKPSGERKEIQEPLRRSKDPISFTSSKKSR